MNFRSITVCVLFFSLNASNHLKGKFSSLSHLMNFLQMCLITALRQIMFLLLFYICLHLSFSLLVFMTSKISGRFCLHTFAYLTMKKPQKSFSEMKSGPEIFWTFSKGTAWQNANVHMRWIKCLATFTQPAVWYLVRKKKSLNKADSLQCF